MSDRTRETRFSDVCGTIDELKRLLAEEYERVAADSQGIVDPLLEDTVFMTDRMDRRFREYGECREKLKELCSLMERVAEVDRAAVAEAAESFQERVKDRGSFESESVPEMNDWAEAIRAVANAQEGTLRSCMDLWLKVGELFQRVKGTRAWVVSADEKESFVGEVARKYQAWLPPEPHRAKLFWFLRDSRASIVEGAGPGDEPGIQFEDGGRIPLSRVRYDENIENFYPATFKPAPTGKEYRQ